MNKAEFIDAYIGKTGVTKKDAEIALKATLEIIEETLVSGEDVNFIGFGSFKSKIQKERDAKVPGTDKKIKVPAKKVVKFSVGKSLKSKVESSGV